MRRRLRRTDWGATAVEYGLIIALIVAVIVGAIALVGSRTFNLFNSVPTF
jgi:pilus assembly protein Flp/PilA